jgi:Cu/Ag efflux protein CusF
MVRLPKWFVVVLALALLVAFTAPAFADVTHGKIKSVAADKKEFVFTDKDGKDWTFQLTDDARIRISDKDVKLNDLKAGEEVAIVYQKQGDKLMASTICTGDVALCKVKSVAADTKELMCTDNAGKDMTFQLADNARIRLTDKDLKLNDLKAGDEVAVIYQKQGNKMVAQEVCGTKK